MAEVGRGFPPGDFRVSDADRDRALSELGEASAILLSAKAVTDALSPGIGWAGATVAPAVLAVLLVGLVIVLHVIRADRS